ncbi:MAG: ribosome-associated translation inhibitor RaiA [Muribaculaceae bacterium]|mgnify:CR=1 FL=1|jgi:putative sigma-54 modulation protein
MDLRIQAIHFDIADRLSDFINKKAERLARRFPAITDFEATLRVVKPETAMNKEALIKIVSPQHDDVVATKTADTFEEAVDLAIEAAERQLEKYKEKR